MNTAFGYGLFALFIWLGMAFPLAIGLATVLGVVFNYQSTGRLVFGGAPRSRFFRFVAVYLAVYVINVAAVAGLLKLGVNIYLANAAVLAPLVIATYMLQRRFVFPRP